jgi:putative sterol carrier protein
MAIRNVREIFEKMPEAFNAAAARDVSAIFQFEITGEGEGTWHVAVKDGTCKVQEGSHDSPTVTLKTSDRTWLAIVNREMNAIQAFITGKLKVSGNIMLAQRIPDLFSF